MSPSSPLNQVTRAQFWLWAAPVIVGVAWIVYRPDSSGPTEVWDFVDFLPRLAPEETLWGKIVATIRLYVPDGRTNLSFYAFIGANEWLFGADPLGWSLTRWLILVVVMFLAAALLRSGGLNGWAACIAVLVWMLHGASATTWVMLMAEPLVMLVLLILLAGELGTGDDVRGGVRSTWGFRFGAVLLLLTLKETAVALLPTLLTLRILRDPGDGSGPAMEKLALIRRHLPTIAACTVVALGIALARAMARPSGYGLRYGVFEGAMERGLRLWMTGILPTRPGAGLSWALLAPANAIWLIVVLGGGWFAWRRGTRPARLVMLALIGLLPVTALAVVYSLWPAPQSYYMMPGALGSAVLLGAAIQEWVRAGRTSSRLLGMTLAVALIAFQAIQADFLTKGLRARAAVYAATATALAGFNNVDTVMVAYPGLGPGHSLDADHLGRYATSVLQLTLPPTMALVDVDCPTAGSMARRQSAGIAVLSFAHGCGRLPDPSRVVEIKAEYVDWLTLSRVVGVSSATIVLPGPSPSVDP